VFCARLVLRCYKQEELFELAARESLLEIEVVGVAEARGQFENPEQKEHPPLKAATV
jgi:hypothetical protein